MKTRVSSLKVRTVVGLVVSLSLLPLGWVAEATNDSDHGALCGSDQQYMCGEILVILNDPAPYGIDQVIDTQGGDPERDLLYTFHSVRDLLANAGEASDLSPVVVYAVAVPVGAEEATANAYATDAAVYAAGVNRETIGSTAPNTAVSEHRPYTHPIAQYLLLAALILVVRKIRRSSGN